ncbi:WD40/YVTN/BNR-like repeat-containing protein [Marinithermus hydrothermalis]|uniref:S-layer repressor n=1 Tax=Marinithermus hydrothermalis (strain DSM 14884 / JCM 11576 / T1) TaxID=869210 RepID=F2NLF0_MARHT|nr:sialidase family protein [Marinithermus hydrothermalis]AEB11769.1 S-layer repressor [Marinithermus hydrothermalis DSM 14884]
MLRFLYPLLVVFPLLAGGGYAQSRIPIATEGLHTLLWLPDGRLLLGHHQGVAVSRDGGRTWRDLFRRPDTEVLALAFDGNRIFVAGHGVYGVLKADGSFVPLTPRGLPSLELDAYAVDPNRPRRHYAWVRDHGLFASEDGGRSWGRIAARGLPPPELGEKQMVHALYLDATGRIFLVGMGIGARWATDLNWGFQPLATPTQDLTGLLADPGGNLWIGTLQGVWRWSRKGWTRVAPGAVIALTARSTRPFQVAWIDVRRRLDLAHP